jgi:hypothetical protein
VHHLPFHTSATTDLAVAHKDLLVFRRCTT